VPSRCRSAEHSRLRFSATHTRQRVIEVINLEPGVLRSIFRSHRIWEAIALDVKFLKESPSPGRALTADEETRLLDAASKSRCGSLYAVMMLAINTGMRASEIRHL
jgi:integrase